MGIFQIGLTYTLVTIVSSNEMSIFNLTSYIVIKQTGYRYRSLSPRVQFKIVSRCLNYRYLKPTPI